MSRGQFVVISGLLMAALSLFGCGGPDKPAKNGGGKPEEHAHEHAHAETGPHGGHLVELAEPGQAIKEEYHVEWEHEKGGAITVWILDGTAKQTVPISADSLFIDITTGDKTEGYELAAVDRTSGENASAFKFEVVSKELLGKITTVGETVAAKIRVDVNGKAYEGKFEAHDEHGHAGHKH